MNTSIKSVKSVKNYSLQGLSLTLETPEGPKTIWLEPKAIVKIPEEFIGVQIRNLHNRRILQISN